MPVPVRHAAIGAAGLGACGAVTGLVVGLRTYAPTAWAATAEVGAPAALLGAVLGLLVGWLSGLVHRGHDD